MQFQVKAVNPGNEVLALHLDAANPAIARDLAERQGLAVLSVAAEGLSAGSLFTWRNRFSATLFSIELLALLEAGLNLVEALQALAEKAGNDESRHVLGRLLVALNEGESFSRALERRSDEFTPLYVATVRAGERTGDLKDSLTRYIAYQEEFERIRRKLISASLYPAILMVVGSAVLLFLMLYVVPRFAKVYEDIHTNLPFFSKLLLALGSVVEAHGVTVVSVLVVLAAALGYGVFQERFRVWLNDRLWSVPSLGERMKLYQLARLYRTLGMLLRAGIPILRAIDMVRGLLAAHLRNELFRARGLLEEGRSISAAFAACGLTTAVAARMLNVGERGGHMGETMERIARFYDDETSRSIDTFTRTFEPILMAVLGLAVGGVVVLMYMPIFELAGSIR